MKQSQFLDVIDRDEAEARWTAALDLNVLPAEVVHLGTSLGRILAEDVRADVDVPSFDRSNMDGFAVQAHDTFGAMEEAPVRLRHNHEVISTGMAPTDEVKLGTASTIATGGMLPRGADAVVPVEYTDLEDGGRVVVVTHAVVPGGAVSFAGTDIGRGETVLFRGTRLTSRETGMLAAVGREHVRVVRRPRVAILSTGNEIVEPGAPMRPGLVFDSNARILCDAVRELGGEPWFVGTFRDEETSVHAGLERARRDSDVILLSGGTSKGEGDLNAEVVAQLDPGILVHGVALKPGKPICLASDGGRPVVILPGFPTSAVFTFHEFVAPVVRRLQGLRADRAEAVPARMAVQIVSERGRHEYLLVGLVERADGELAAYPMGKGSGSVTAFSRADGFVRIDRNTEIVDADAEVAVTLIGRELEPADLVVIGSHCIGLDAVAAALLAEGFTVKLVSVGSQGGLAAAGRGECDVAPIHLLDTETGEYNRPLLPDGVRLLRGYTRMQGVVTRTRETRDVQALLADPEVRMVNRNRGAGTRVLIDRLLGERRPPGHAYEPRSHNAVAAAVSQGRADWGVTIEPVAARARLRFQPLRPECYDFAIPEDRWERPAVRALRRLLEDGSPLRAELRRLGFDAEEGR
jgi:putative molybdopterin biosynthesis protein